MATDLQTDFHPAVGEINKYDFRTTSKPVFKARKGIDAEIVAQISEMKDEPDWMREFRLQSLEIFNSKPMPRWGGKIGLNFQDIYYYLKPAEHQGRSWDDVPEEIKRTFDRLGIPEAEKKYLAGVKAQFESEVVYGSLKEDLQEKGVIFTDTDTRGEGIPRPGTAVLRNDYSTFGQQIRGAQLGGLVGRIVYLRPQGREDRFPTTGVFPDQRREHGPVRADADHRR